MSVELDVVSIGTLGANPLWGEREPVRAGHATTTLVRSGDVTLLVDPALPPEALAPRLAERTGLEPGSITHVFLTSFRPDVRRALPMFDGAAWWIAERERQTVGVPMGESLKLAAEQGRDDLVEALRRDVALLSRCEPAPDSLADRVDLFPLPGVTPGLCGLLIAGMRHTTLICGDAIPDRAHLDAGKVLPQCADLELARESFTEAVEIADLLVPGRDNIIVNPTKRPF